jgi:hypothetical protein
MPQTPKICPVPVEGEKPPRKTMPPTPKKPVLPPHHGHGPPY